MAFPFSESRLIKSNYSKAICSNLCNVLEALCLTIFFKYKKTNALPWVFGEIRNLTLPHSNILNKRTPTKDHVNTLEGETLPSSTRGKVQNRDMYSACLTTISKCVTFSERWYEVNHSMLFRSNFNDESSAALGEKKIAYCLCEP